MLTLERPFRPAVKLLTEGPSGWLRLVRAQKAIWRAWRLVRTRPRGELFRDLAFRPHPPAPANPAHRPRVEEVGLALDRTARFGLGRPLCLVRSLAFQDLLEGEGISGSRIAVGVRKRAGRLEAHAWVEWNGSVVGEDATYVASFVPLTDDQAPRESALPHGFR